MTLQELMNIVIGSQREDWLRIPCWGVGSGPSYRFDLDQEDYVEDPKEQPWISVRRHSDVAIYKHDVLIGLAWGIPANEDFQEDWANQFPDSHASSFLVDVFYTGCLSYRAYLVAVDGGRIYLPMPQLHVDNENMRVTSRSVTRSQVAFARLLHLMAYSDSRTFDHYLERTGFTITTDPWP
jgi:hypothetical protein